MFSGSIGTFAFASILVLLATLVRSVFGFLGEEVFVFAGYYPAVLFATYVGGPSVGVYTAVVSGVVAWWAFISPHFGFFPLTLALATKLAAFLFACALIIWGADRYRTLLKALEDEQKSRQGEERFRELAVEELAHRLKNKIATIQSIISFQLRDSPETRDAILGRLTALSATDDLILEAQGQGARLWEILSTELRPYETSRVAIEGPAALLSPRLAMTMALLIHELATNSAKYGALSNATGRIAISWSLSGARLSLEWRERGGPIVTTPIHQGFGMRLLSRALQDYGGAVETAFEPTGLVCRLNVTLSETTSVSTAAPSQPRCSRRELPLSDVPLGFHDAPKMCTSKLGENGGTSADLKM